MENKSHKEQLLVVAPSFLDDLGHFEYINEISKGLSDDYEVSILCQDYKESSNLKKISSQYSLMIKNFNIFSLGDSLETKIFLKNILFLRNIIHGLVKFIFHLKVHKAVLRNATKKILYLETEPFSLMFFRSLNKKGKRVIVTLHAVDFNSNHSGLKKIYKLILKLCIGRISKKIFSLAVHNKRARERLLSLGVSAEKVFISGWGINKPNIKPKNSCEDSLTCLVFGVLRKSKRIERLVDIFLEADDPRLKLELIGKNIDIDISSLMRRIRNSKSKTRIEIEDRFVQREEFNTIFERADLFVLSHDMTFQSISGPLFNAVESNRPILCFSYADTREMVKKNNLGECVNMENMNQPLHNICKNALSNYKPESMDYFLWGNIVARIKDNLKKDA